MRRSANRLGQTRRASARFRMIQHDEEVTRNVALGALYSELYIWMRRYRHGGLASLLDRLRATGPIPLGIPSDVISHILRIGQEGQYGSSGSACSYSQPARPAGSGGPPWAQDEGASKRPV